MKQTIYVHKAKLFHTKRKVFYNDTNKRNVAANVHWFVYAGISCFANAFSRKIILLAGLNQENRSLHR